MGAFTKGSVVLIRFPFSDLSNQKLRPAVVIAQAGQGDYILCQVTSKAYDPLSVELRTEDFVEGTLQRLSYARPGKLFTAHYSILVREVGKLTAPKSQEVVDGVIALLRNAESIG